MSFQNKYRIQSALSDGEVRSYRALQISSGRPVLVHHLPAGRTSSQQPDLASLIFRFLRTESAEESGHFLDMGDLDGGVFVVTADVAECLDLRQWLESVIAAQPGTQPEAETPGAEDVNSTRVFSTDALRHSFAESATPAPPGPLAAPPAGLPEEPSPGVLTPPAENPDASSLDADNPPSTYSGFWEQSSAADPSLHPAPVPPPSPSPESPQGPSEFPVGTVKFVVGRSAWGDQDASAPAPTPLPPPSAEREPPPAAVAGPAPARGYAGSVGDVILRPPEVRKPPVQPRAADVSQPLPPPTAAPSANDSGTKILPGFTGLWGDGGNTPLPASAPGSPSPGDFELEADLILAEDVPTRQMPTRLEASFPSGPPDLPPASLNLPEPSKAKPAPPPSAPKPPAHAPARAVLPKVVPPVAQQALREAQRPTRLVEPPPQAPARPVPRAPAGGAAPAPPVASPAPAPPKPAPPAGNLRRVENGKAAPSPPPPAVAAAGQRAAANRAVPAPPPLRAAPVSPSGSQPLLHLDLPAPSARKKRRVWVPILILSSLFLMTVALLTFYAFKH